MTEIYVGGKMTQIHFRHLGKSIDILKIQLMDSHKYLLLFCLALKEKE